MFSGGLDSTFMLYYYLTQTDYSIHAHHISLRYPSEPRWEEEELAARRIAQYCQRFRAFDYTESRFDFGFKHYAGRDSDTQLLVAAKVAPNLRGEVHVAIGWENSDLDLPINQYRMENHITQKLWKALCDSIDYPFGESVSRDLLFPLMDMNLNKKMMLNLLPKELIDMTWSCRKPIRNESGSKPCGECKPCRTIRSAIKN